jgi:hypothetical protein
VIPLDGADDHINGDAHHIIQIRTMKQFKSWASCPRIALLATPRLIDGGYLCPKFRPHLLPIPNC